MKKYILFIFIPFLASCSISFVGPNQKDSSSPSSVSTPLSGVSEISVQGTIEKIPAQSIFSSDTYTLKTPEGITYLLKSPVSEDFSGYLASSVSVNGKVALGTSEKGVLPILTVVRINKISGEDESFVFTEVSNGVSVRLLPSWSLEKGITQSDWTIQNSLTEKKLVNLTFHTAEEAALLIEKEFLDGQGVTVAEVPSLRIAKGNTHRILLRNKPFLEISFIGSESDLANFYDFLLNITIGNNNSTLSPTPSTNEKNTPSFSPSPFLLPSNSPSAPPPNSTPVPTPIPASVSPSQEAPETSEEENVEHEKVISALAEQIPSLSPENIQQQGEKLKINRTTFLGKNTLSVEYSSETEKRRATFQYKIEQENISFTLVSYYKPGETTSWTLVEGSTPTVIQGEEKIIYLESGKQITIPSGYELYTSKNFGFQLAYPKRLYYSGVGKREESDSLATIFFAEGPATSENAVMSVEIHSDSKENVSGNALVVPRDETSYFLLTAIDPVYQEVIDIMAKTIQTL
jgi:hypothetical protein